MAADAVFGQSFDFSFTPLRGTAEVAPNSLVSARLYSELPSDAQKADHTNALNEALQSITSWSAGTSTAEKLITFAEILDPDPTSANPYETYYVVVSFKYGAATETEAVLIPLSVFRSGALKSRYGLAAAQIYEFESKLSDLEGDTWVNTKISRAEKVLKDYLRDHSVDYNKINPEEFQNLLAYQACILIAVDLQSLDRDVWESKLEYYTDKFETIFSKMKFRYDYDGDKNPAPDEVKEIGIAILGR